DLVVVQGLAHDQQVAVAGVQGKGFLGAAMGVAPIRRDPGGAGRLLELLANRFAVLDALLAPVAADALRQHVSVTVYEVFSWIDAHDFGAVFLGQQNAGVDTTGAGLVVAEMNGDTAEHGNPLVLYGIDENLLLLTPILAKRPCPDHGHFAFAKTIFRS